MLYPSINLLRKKVDSKYTLVSLAAERARDLIDGKPSLIETDLKKPVSIAVEEIASDMITYNRNENPKDEIAELREEILKEINEKKNFSEVEMEIK